MKMYFPYKDPCLCNICKIHLLMRHYTVKDATLYNATTNTK